MKAGWLVIGVGNPDRGDDGLGPLVVRRLAEMELPGVTIIERSGDGLALIEDWGGYDAVVLIDAAAPVGVPGRIHRLDLAGEELPVEFSRASTHAFGVAEAVRLARTLGRLPARAIVYAVEAVNFDAGAGLSAEVAAAVPALLTHLAAELRTHWP